MRIGGDVVVVVVVVEHDLREHDKKNTLFSS
jgi:hypothetical protein